MQGEEAATSLLDEGLRTHFASLAVSLMLGGDYSPRSGMLSVGKRISSIRGKVWGKEALRQWVCGVYYC